jgi:hypothetical protein
MTYFRHPEHREKPFLGYFFFFKTYPSMEKNKKFDAEKLADELWADMEAKSESLRSDAAKMKLLKAFFKKYQLDKPQAEEVMASLQRHLATDLGFDVSPLILELYDLWTHKQFHYFFKDKDTTIKRLNTSDIDMTRFFNERKIPMWQREQIIIEFFMYMQDKSRENRQKVFIPLLVCYGGALLLALFTPMILQRLGFLAPDAGWVIKILNTIGSFIFLFLIARRVNSFWLDKVLLGK